MPENNTFCLNTPEIQERQMAVRRVLDRINTGDWENYDERMDFIRSSLGSVGKDPFILFPMNFTAGKNIHLGDNVFINGNVTFIDVQPIRIGDHTMIAPGCVITSVGHPTSPGQRRGFTSYSAPITIGRDVWIGANCTIFPGVTIGDNVIVGANSIVNRDVPSNCVVAGAPARIIREHPDDTEDAWSDV